MKFEFLQGNIDSIFAFLQGNNGAIFVFLQGNVKKQLHNHLSELRKTIAKSKFQRIC